MTATEHEGAELDALRRRLYRADATDADLRQYLDERAAGTEPEQPEARVEPPRRPRRFLLAGAAAGVLLLAVAATGVLIHRAAPAPRHSAAATEQPLTVRVNVGDGELLPVRPGQVTGPTATPLMIDGAAIAAERFDGIGAAVVMVHLPGAEFGTLRAVVAASSSRSSTIEWRALRVVSGQNAATSQEVVDAGRISTRVGSATPNPFTYVGAPPTSVAVEAPAGLRWTLLVAPANGTSDDLR